MTAPFFKLLGGTDPVGQEIGAMTQGLGFPLRSVEPATSGGTVVVSVEDALIAESLADQDPVGLGVALQVTLGPAQTTAYFDVDALGNVTCLATDEYTLRAKFTIGRSGGGGESQIYTRLLVNGVPVGPSSHTIIDNARIEIPFDFEANGVLTAGDVLTFEIIRDTDGNNSGGLSAGIPDVAGWASSPSARLLLTRFVAVET